VTEAEFRAYIDAFNRDDFDAYAAFYADDVEIAYRGGELVVRGKDAIVSRYRDLHQTVRQHLEIQFVACSERHVAGEMHSSFTALADMPDFIVRPMKAGETARIHTFVHYDLDHAGKFRRIRSVRYRTLA
jgi:hypothetical protein